MESYQSRKRKRCDYACDSDLAVTNQLRNSYKQ